ncbi:MAG: acyl-CoA dehydrogenase [Acidobacteria bacterium]|nr:acyl-CoA dehydrogenase [Acidobacteriota bacterium]
MSRVKVMLDEFLRADGSDVPLPGSGETWRRFEVLSLWASRDLSVGRLAEGHVDALAILAEAEMEPFNEISLYGVWAARSRAGGTSAKRVSGGWELTGRKEFCSGSGLIDRALVTADTTEGYRLFDVSVDEHVASSDNDSWPAVGMADSVSETLEFAGPVIPESCAVGGPDFYTTRPGFWFGAAGVAACWYGGACGLVNNLINSLPAVPSEHVLADLGKAVAHIESMHDVLKSAADAIDRDPQDVEERAHYRALVVRQVVHDAAMEVLVRVGAAGGARPLCHDLDQSRRAADLFVYLSQHHGGSDATELGQLAREERSWH